MSEQTFAEQVETLVSKAIEVDGARVLDKTKQEDILKDVPIEVLDAAQRELRYRNTQASFTRAQQESKKHQEISKQLTDQLISNSTIHITAEQQEELDELKLKDPDAWREKLTTYEAEAKTILQAKVDEAHQAGHKVSELELRQIKLDAFTESTGIALNDQIIEEQLPAKYTKQLESGEITFDQFLEAAKTYLTKGSVVAGTDKSDEALKDENLKDFKKLSGTTQPNEHALESDAIDSYRSEIY